MTPSQQRIVDTALSWRGTPFHHQGRAKGVGVDCIGFIAGVAGELGLAVPAIPTYGRRPDGAALKAALDRHLVPLGLDAAAPAVAGTVLLFWVMPRFKRPQHVAICLAPPRMIHAWEKAGAVAATTIDKFWRPRAVARYGFPVAG